MSRFGLDITCLACGGDVDVASSATHVGGRRLATLLACQECKRRVVLDQVLRPATAGERHHHGSPGRGLSAVEL